MVKEVPWVEWVRVGLLAWVLVDTGAQMMVAKGVKGVNLPMLT